MRPIPSIPASIVCAALITAGAAAQGSFATYGTGCAGSAGVPAIGHRGPPQTGATLEFTLTNANANAPAFPMLGFAQQSLSLGLFGAPQCTVLVAPTITMTTISDGSGSASIGLPIPNDPGLDGTRLYAQWGVLDPGAGNALRLALSEGACAELGSSDELIMDPTPPTQGNFPALPRRIEYQLLGFAPAAAPIQVPGVGGSLLIDPTTLVLVPDSGGFGSELTGYLEQLGTAWLYSQLLQEDDDGQLVLSELLVTGGDGLSSQVDDRPTCEARATTFLQTVVRDGLADGWHASSGVGPPVPFYRPDVVGVAYYEFPVSHGGFIVVSTGEHDLPIAHWSDRGEPIERALDHQARANQARIARIYKVDALSYVGEDATGLQVAQIGDLPTQLLPDPTVRGGYTQRAWSSWGALKAGYVQSYRAMIENLKLAGADQWQDERNPGASTSWGPWTYSWAGSHDDQRSYNQFLHGPCLVGCGPVAWMMLFGWADHRAAIGDPKWAHRWGLYRQNGGRGANADAPAANDPGVRNALVEIHDHVLTLCSGTSGLTAAWTMHRADRYLSGRTGATLTTHYDLFGVHRPALRNLARDSIVAGKPTVVGTGWLAHYPLAYGYAERSKRVWWGRKRARSFYVNNGWGGAANGWVAAETWFCGRLFAN
ncbi:MAG: hypothetical protein R3F56_19865 [Planctomycetota bacterium]